MWVDIIQVLIYDTKNVPHQDVVLFKGRTGLHTARRFTSHS